LFFGISPREAQQIDPQERLFLQASFSVLEDAGYTKQSLAQHYRGRVGVYAGITKSYSNTNFSSVANRVSYLLDLHGPSMPIDTMCSASLTAIHEACEHIGRGECELAIAGGVNLYLHPSSYVGLCAQRMLSKGGQCRSFGAAADGFVPGEGVGAVLLKPLSRAIAEHDHIYGVIRASSINHGGKTHGYTVPSPLFQGELIESALKRGQIDARQVSYIEAHGTGTELGDPIEIAGLQRAFAGYTQEREFCAIGSVKSNIGHLESAAGIAGLTKVLLQMKHKELVPSLHASELNPHIDFSLTPFKVQRSLSPWERPSLIHNGESREYPRLAGISSFGAGGANAHLIVEEYIEGGERELSVPTPEHPALIVLSGKSEERLRERVEQLHRHLSIHSLSDADLADIAYTLQVGREGMEHRLGFTALTLEELKGKLESYLEGKALRGEVEHFYRGELKKNKEAVAALNADTDTVSLIELWLEKGKYGKLLELWVQGLSFNWEQLYESTEDSHPKRLSLPTYPFAKERFWIEAGRGDQGGGGGAAPLHPLLHRNISSFEAQRFSTRLTGEEFFLRDHRIGANRVLPAVAYLEMARAAFRSSVAGACTGDQRGIELGNLVWLEPLTVEREQELHISLQVDESGRSEFQICSPSAELRI